jgi:signal transduction histidine kinase
MREYIASWPVPSAEDADLARRQYLLNLVLLGLAVPGFIFGLAMAVVWVLGGTPITGALAGLGVQPSYLLAYWLGRRGRTRLAAYVPVFVLFLVMTGATYQLGIGHVTLVGYAMVTLTAGILIGTNAALLFALLSTGAYLAVGMAQAAGGLPGELAPETTAIADGIGMGLGLVVLVIFHRLSDREMNRALHRERGLSAELRANRAELEQRVAERTTELTTVNEQLQREVTERKRAEQLLKGLNRAALAMEKAITHEEIFAAVAEEFRELGSSCVVFLTDENQSKLFPEYLTYEAAALKAAERLVGLKCKDFFIPIAAVDAYRRAVWEKKTVFVEDAENLVRQLLPDYLKRFAGQILRIMKVPRTIDAPLVVEDEVIGVLAVQSDELTEEDIPTITAFAHQMAAVWHKAKLMQDLRTSLTERKQAEEKLRTYASKLERSNRELQDFVFVASHDLQEPLRKVQAFGSRLQNKYSEALGDQGRDYLERMQSAAARMQTQIKDLLAYSRVTTRAQPFVPVDLSKVAQEVVSDLGVRIEQVGGQVEVGGLPTIEADPDQMRQLLQHLIGNALKFHREGETPVVKIHAESLNGQGEGAAGASAGDGLWQIMVEDNGIGFDEKYLERIFQVFQRLHGRSEYEGTGIGLATCRKIIERHGGSITAKSAPGQGATFIVTLPVRQPR